MIRKEEEYEVPEVEILVIQIETGVLKNSIEDAEEDDYGDF